MSNQHLFNAIVVAVSATLFAALTPAQALCPGATQSEAVRVLNFTGLPVGITRACVSVVGGRRVINYTLHNRGAQRALTAQWQACFFDPEHKPQCLLGGQWIVGLEPGASREKEFPLRYGETWLKNYKVAADADLMLVLWEVEWEGGSWSVGEDLFRAVKAFAAGEEFEQPTVYWRPGERSVVGAP